MAARQQSLLNVQNNLANVIKNIESNLFTRIQRLENNVIDKIDSSSEQLPDYIVVGSGPGGSSFARRMVEAGYSVLMLEQGNDLRNTKYSKASLQDDGTPADVDLVFDIYETWLLNTEPYFIDNKPEFTGRSVGGGTAINGLLFNHMDANLTRSYLPLTTQSAIEEAVNTIASIVPTATNQNIPPLYRDLFTESIPPDNGDTVFFKDGSRSATTSNKEDRRFFATDLLDGYDELFTLKSNTQVARILFNGNKAVGVELTDGTPLYCRKEVIVAGGAFFTPKLLMDSGIGPAADLQSYGIEVVSDLPDIGVYRDHTGFPAFATWARNDSGFKRNPRYILMQGGNIASGWQYYTSSQYLCIDSGIVIYFFFDPNSPIFLPNTLPIFTATEKQENYREARLEQVSKDRINPIIRNFNQQNFDFTNKVVRVTNILGAQPKLPLGRMVYRGPTKRMDIVATDEWKTEELYDRLLDALEKNKWIDPRLFVTEHPEAQQTFPNGVVTDLPKDVFDLDFLRDPQNETVRAKARQQVKEVMSKGGRLHPTGTCAQGEREKGGVVDQSFKVYGTEGLRVVDNSVAAETPIINTMALAYVIGRTAANVMLEEIS